ncbi:carboxypeptidase-like regulatory domain-containing protein, partial [Nakamurella sp. GG22]
SDSAHGCRVPRTSTNRSTGDVGRWTVAGLAIPSRYTVTFSRADLESQTVAVTLDAAGQLSSGSGVGPDGITVAMTSAFAEVSGVVSQRSPDGRTQPVGEAVITLSSGTDEYSVISASEPASQVGAFQVGGVAPGTYTLSASRRGTSPTSVIVTVAAGESRQFNPVLIPPASITGKVTDQLGREVAGLEVVLFKASEYPAQPAQQTTTDAVGGYSFADVDAPQAYVVEVRSRTQGALGSATLVLNASQAAVLNISVGAPAASSSPVPVRQPVPGPTTTVTQSAPAPPRPAAPTPAVGSTPTTQAGPTAQAAPSRTAAPTSATTTPTAALTTPAMTAAQVLGMTP